MRCKYFFPLVLGLSLLIAIPAFGQSEDELVARFLKKTETKQAKKIGYVVFSGSYGRLKNVNDYNRFAEGISPLITGLNGSYDHVDGIFRSKEFFVGLGIMGTPKLSLAGGFSYWLKLGRTPVGDYNLSLLSAEDAEDHNGFDLKSEVQVYGFAASVDYYLMNPPDQQGVLRGLAVKALMGGGYYFARWQLWEGFDGYNLAAQETEDITGKLAGAAPGFTVGMAVEYPLRLAGLVVEAAARYQYLNFASMKWYNGNNEETTVVQNGTTERVNLDFSGPRAQFGLKRYFGW